MLGVPLETTLIIQPHLLQWITGTCPKLPAAIVPQENDVFPHLGQLGVLAISIEYLKLNNTANIVINKDKNEFMRRFNKYGFGTVVGVPTAATINNYDNGKWG